MGVVRATKTVTAFVLKDSFTDSDNPTINYGDEEDFHVSATAVGSHKKHGTVMLQMPDAPADADVDASDEQGITKLELTLYASQAGTGTSNRAYHVDEFTRDFDEDQITQETRPNVGGSIGDPSSGDHTVAQKTAPGQTHVFDLTQGITLFGFRWGHRISLDLWFSNTIAEDFWAALEHATAALRPFITITFQQKPPLPVTDLKAEAASDDPTLTDCEYVQLTWTPSEEEDFDSYEIWRKVGAGAWAQVGAAITQQGATEFIDDTGGLTENVVIEYYVKTLRPEISGGNQSENDGKTIWLIRPDVTSLVLDDTTPDAGQKVTATVTPAAIATTPSAVTNTDFYVAWGTSAQDDTSHSRWVSGDAAPTRDHIFPYAGTQSPKARIKNGLGFWSDLTDHTPASVTVANPGPTAKIVASPVEALVDVTITLSLAESHTGAGNKVMHAVTGYKFRVEQTPGSATFDDTEQATPVHTFTKSSAGAYEIRGQVKDEDSNVSPEVVLGDVTFNADTVVDLDAMVDGWNAIEYDFGNNLIIQAGPDAIELLTAGKRPVRVQLRGVAFRSPTNDIPADILTLQDVRDNNKRVSTARITGTAVTGTLENVHPSARAKAYPVHDWTATLVFDVS